MSAIASMFNQPKVKHTPSRLVFSGKTVTGKKDLPPLPDASAREAVKEEISRLAYKRKLEANRKYAWRKKNEEPWECRKRFEEWKKENPEKYKQAQKDYREKNRDAVNEYKRKWRAKNKEHIAKYNREYQERKQNAKKIRQSEIGTSNPSPQELGSTTQRGSKPRTRITAPRLQAVETGNANVSATSV